MVAQGVKKENMQFFVAQKGTAGKWRVHWEIIVWREAAERPLPGNVCKSLARDPPLHQETSHICLPPDRIPSKPTRQAAPTQRAGSK